MKIYEINEKLYTDIGEKQLYIKNAWKLHNSFHLVHGWHISKEPISLDAEYEIMLDKDNTCRIIK